MRFLSGGTWSQGSRLTIDHRGRRAGSARVRGAAGSAGQDDPTITSNMELTLPRDKLGLVLKVGLYIFLAVAGLMFFPLVLQIGGIMIAAALGTFAAAAVANA